MILKIIKALWFFSLLAWFAFFMYIYASLPEQVVVQENESRVLISREAFFYLFLAVIAIMNLQIFAVSKLFRGREAFLTWFYGLIVCLNFFFVVVLNFISLFNSGEKFRYSSVGYLIYGSIGLLILWAVAWPVVALIRKFLSKQPV